MIKFPSMGSKRHSGRSISAYSYDSVGSTGSHTSIIVKNKGKRLQNFKAESLLEQLKKNQQNILTGLHHSISKLLKGFEEQLNNTTTITIFTKIKPASENPLRGKQGHLITTSDNKTIAVLLSPIETRACCANTICTSFSENDPINYYVVNPTGEELMSVSGLDESTDTNNVVVVTLTSLRDLVGTIMYNQLGADGETLSRVTLLAAGKAKAPAVPISVTDTTGQLSYIFRRDRTDDLVYTELLTADGNAIVVAEIIMNYKGKTSTDKSRNVPENVARLAESFEINFIQDSVKPKEKALILGISITIFNQWLTRQSSKKRCCTIM